MNKLNIFIVLLIFVAASCSKQTSTLVETPVMETNKDVFRSKAPEPGPARKINMGEYHFTQLDNGLQVIVVENHKLPRVSYQISLNSLPVLEKEQAGYVSIAGDLLATGTKSRKKADIDAEVDFVGATLNTFSTGMFGSSLTKHQDKLLQLMSDVLYNPVFPQDEFEKLKKQYTSTIQANRTDPNAMAQSVSSVLRNGKDHPYGEVQTEKSIENIDLENCKNYYDTFFRPNNATLTIVGDVTPAEAESLAHKYFGGWKRGTVPTISYDMPKTPEGAKVAFVNKEGAVQSVIRITYPVDLSPGDADAIPASVMNRILGGGFSGRLNQNLREDKAFTYGARSSVSSDRLVGSFSAFASVRNEVTDSSIHEFIYEMERIISENVIEEDLQVVKNAMTGSFARSLESPQTIARFARNIKLYNLPSDYYETYLEKLNAVTIEDVAAMAKKYVNPDNAYIVVVGSKDDVAEKLVKFDSDGEIDYYDPFGNLLEASDDVIPADMTAASVISDYFDAMGGKEKLMAIKTIEQSYKMDMMGQPASITMYQKAPNMFAMTVNAMGMVVQEQRYDGVKGLSASMGQSQVLTEGPGLDQMKKQAVMIPQLNYSKEGYALELKGIEDVDGTKCYKLTVVDPNGEKSTEFYSVDKSLLIRSVQTADVNGQAMTIVNDSGDYKMVDGILFPHKITTSGVMPTPMVMEATTIKVNQELADDKFTVE